MVKGLPEGQLQAIETRLLNACPMIDLSPECGWRVHTTEWKGKENHPTFQRSETPKPLTERIIVTKLDHGQLKAPEIIVGQAFSPYYESTADKGAFISITEERAEFIARAPEDMAFLLELVKAATGFQLGGRSGLSIERRNSSEPYLYAITDGSGDVWQESTVEWVYECLPSNRTEQFITQTRYPLEQALLIAKRLLEERKKDVQ